MIHIIHNHMKQTFPNPVGPSDLTGKIYAGPGGNWISPDQMSGNILDQEYKLKSKMLYSDEKNL